MTKKVKHAQEPAGGKPETVLEDIKAAGAEQEASALVEGDGARAAGGAEQQGGPAGETELAAQPAGLVDADVPYGDAAGAVPPAGQDGDVAAGIEENDDDAVNQALGEDAGHSGDGAISVTDLAALNGTLGTVDISGASIGSVDPDQHLTPFQILYRDDKHFPAAIEAAGRSLEVALRILDPDPEKSLSEIAYAHENLNGSAFAEAANYMRQIGHARATVDVVATQLRLSGHRDDRPVTGAERVALEVFLFTLASLDGLAKAEADRRAREEEERNRKPAPATPIDETTMEPVDGPMATW